MLRVLIAAIAVALLPASLAHAQAVDVARFVDPAMARSASISPNGQYVAYIRRTADGMAIVLQDHAANTMRVLESIRRDYGEINWVSWKGDGHVLAGIEAYVGREVDRRVSFGAQNRGDKVSIFRIVSISLDGAPLVQMFSGQGHQLAWGYGSTLLLDSLPNDPAHVLLMASDNAGVGVWRTEVATGHAERVADGTWDTRGYTADGAGYPVLRLEMLASGGYRVLRRASGSGPWINAMDVRGDLLRSNSPDFSPIAAGPGPNQVYVFARQGQRDFSAVYLYDTSTGAFGEPVFASNAADVDDVWLHPMTHALLAGCAFAKRLTCSATDPVFQRNLNAVNGFFANNATVRLVDMSADASKWLLVASSPTEASTYFVYDVTHHSVTPLAQRYPSVDTALLSPTQVVDYQSRDGTALWAYVTARPGVTGPRPMVVFPHGGPESRDDFGYDAYVEFLAAHGYVVLQPNFRGSSGSGRAFADAGRGQWGLRMQDDITDAVRAMITAGVADPQRICIVGASYGGYAALAGAALTPDLYKCAISISGVSDLPTMLRAERAEGGHLSMSYQYWRYSMGDPSANRDALIAASPARQSAHVTAPVLLIHGEEDETVPIEQSEMMERALRGAGKSVRLVRLPDADHYWDRWSTDNRTTLFRESEAFLEQYLH